MGRPVVAYDRLAPVSAQRNHATLLPPTRSHDPRPADPPARCACI